MTPGFTWGEIPFYKFRDYYFGLDFNPASTADDGAYSDMRAAQDQNLERQRAVHDAGKYVPGHTTYSRQATHIRLSDCRFDENSGRTSCRADHALYDRRFQVLATREQLAHLEEQWGDLALGNCLLSGRENTCLAFALGRVHDPYTERATMEIECILALPQRYDDARAIRNLERVQRGQQTEEFLLGVAEFLFNVGTGR